MPKVSKNNFPYNGIVFDSKEEIQFYIFLRDIKKLGLILEFEYQPSSFLLIPKAEIEESYHTKSGKLKIKTKTLYRDHSYTADFKVIVNPETFYASPIYQNGKLNVNNLTNTFYVDVKGSYNKFGGDRIFPIHQKMVYWKFKEHVNKIIPDELFLRIGYVPEELRWMKNRKEKTLYTKYLGLKSLEELSTKNVKTINNNKKTINVGFLPDLKNGKNNCKQGSLIKL